MPNEINLLQEVRDDVKALREEVQTLKTDIAVYKAYVRAVNWVMFTCLPTIGAGLAYIGVKLGISPIH
jgi:hypothetical protein